MTLVDTGVWFRYYHKLPLRSALVTYLEANPPLYLSAISVWEIATKHRLGKLPCPPLAQWLEQALADYESARRGSLQKATKAIISDGLATAGPQSFCARSGTNDRSFA